MANPAPLVAEIFDSGFAYSHDSYNCISTAPDGTMYYVLASAEPSVGGQLCSFNPLSGTIANHGNLTDLCGESAAGSIAQGKSHDGFYPFNNELFFSTHIGFYEPIDGMERMPSAGYKGFKSYPGGHLLSINPVTKKITDHVSIPAEGILAMTLDALRGIAYLLSWPTGLLYRYDILQQQLILIGNIAGKGEAGTAGKDYQPMCRSLLLEPSTGRVFGSTAEGKIFRYCIADNQLIYLPGTPLKRDYFGVYATNAPGTMAYNWRKICWNNRDGFAYGVHGNSGYLFRFNTVTGVVELMDRIASKPSQTLGMFDQFSYGYLGFALMEETQTIYYLCGGPLSTEITQYATNAISKGGAQALENLHLISYRLPTRTHIDHGAVYYKNGKIPTYVNAIAIGKDNYIYTLARLAVNDPKTDLIRIPVPFAI